MIYRSYKPLTGSTDWFAVGMYFMQLFTSILNFKAPAVNTTVP